MTARLERHCYPKACNRVISALSLLDKRSLCHSLSTDHGHSLAQHLYLQQVRSLTSQFFARAMDKCLQHSCHFLPSRITCRKQLAGRTLICPAAPRHSTYLPQRCNASMGLGFTDGLVLPQTSQPYLKTPSNSYGLSTRQMAALGLTEDSISKPLEANEVLMRVPQAIFTTCLYAGL